MWVKLTDVQDEKIYHGAVFRFPAKYPYENVVDFMVYEPIPYDGSMGLMVTTGFKAGLTVQILPSESSFDEHTRAISKKWLIDNWCAWVYPDTSVDNVLFTENYDVLSD